MLQQVILISAVTTTLNIDSVDPDEIIICKSVSGLTPPPLTLFTGDYSRDGGYYQGRRLQERNPVFNLKLNPDYKNDIELSDIREQLYEIFYSPSPVSDGLRVILVDDRKPDRQIECYPETFDQEIFSRSTDGSISTLCVDPYLRSVASTEADDPVGWTTLPVTYPSPAPAGLLMTLKVKTATAQVVVDINGYSMTLTRAFAVNDIIQINTSEGQRKITVNGVDIMASLSAASRWLQLKKGVNTIKVFGTVVNDGKAALMGYNYTAAWWGI